jgi:hypothetical protein
MTIFLRLPFFPEGLGGAAGSYGIRVINAATGLFWRTRPRGKKKSRGHVNRANRPNTRPLRATPQILLSGFNVGFESKGGATHS